MSLWFHRHRNRQPVTRMMPRAGLVAMTAIPVRHPVAVWPAFSTRLRGCCALLAIVAIMCVAVMCVVVVVTIVVL